MTCRPRTEGEVRDLYPPVKKGQREVEKGSLPNLYFRLSEKTDRKKKKKT